MTAENAACDPARLPDDVAFAAAVVSYAPGSPQPTPDAMNGQTAVGPPDYTEDRRVAPRAVSLGDGGWLVLRFDGAGLGDAPGPDLFVFEIAAPDAVELSVSEDGRTWREVGSAAGGASAIDIAPYVKEGETFHFVRLHDVPRQGARTDVLPGADIDAVGVHPGVLQRYEVSSAVLFSFDDARLGPAAPSAFDQALASIRARPAARVTVSGHTDSIGTPDYNQALSERRARSVADYLVQRGVAPGRLAVRGAGADEPAVPNDSEDHRQQNRRVEITIDGR